MPFPVTPLVIEGGCNCKAIRYRITIPEFHQRPLYPGGGAALQPPVRMPLICTDHCNDCRSATGAILPFWCLTPIDMVQASCLPAALLPTDGKLNDDMTSNRVWHPAIDIFSVDKADPGSCLSFFASSPNRRRSFCRRCGTMLAYHVFPLPSKWPQEWPVMLDLILGTIDRHYLEKWTLAPERQLWWDRGIGWIKDFASAGENEKLPVHPSFKVDQSA